MRAEGSLPAVLAAARAMAAGGLPVASAAPAAKRFPVALPDDVVAALFPAADPEGPVTTLWMGKGCPPFLRRHEAADGSVWWIFEGLWLRSRDGAVEEMTQP
jgi:hypothetical protein